VTDRKNRRIFFDMPNPTAGCGASGRRRRRRRRHVARMWERKGVYRALVAKETTWETQA
jgi:hypothetical protein